MLGEVTRKVQTTAAAISRDVAVAHELNLAPIGPMSCLSERLGSPFQIRDRDRVFKCILQHFNINTSLNDTRRNPKHCISNTSSLSHNSTDSLCGIALAYALVCLATEHSAIRGIQGAQQSRSQLLTTQTLLPPSVY
jgi:hypothetical protein